MGVYIRIASSVQTFFAFHKTGGKKIQGLEMRPPQESLWHFTIALLFFNP